MVRWKLYLIRKIVIVISVRPTDWFIYGFSMIHDLYEMENKNKHSQSHNI